MLSCCSQDFLLYAIVLCDSTQRCTDTQPSAVGTSHSSAAPEAQAAAAPSAASASRSNADAGAAAEAGPPQSADSQSRCAAAASTTAAEARRALRLYQASAGKYAAGGSAFMAPVYGVGELPQVCNCAPLRYSAAPSKASCLSRCDILGAGACCLQAFCRVAAVAGATYVLRHAVAAVLLDAATRECVGVRTVAGQTLRCGALAADVASLREMLRRQADDSQDDCTSYAEQAPGVARAVCITDASLQVNPTWSILVGLKHALADLQRCAAMLQSDDSRVRWPDDVLPCQQEGITQLFAVMPPRALPGSNDESSIRILQV